MRDVIEACATQLATDSPAFTQRNLYYAVRRTLGRSVTESAFDAALRKLSKRAPIPGLLPPPSRWPSRKLSAEWDAYFPAAVVLVDRPSILDLFIASGVIPKARLAVIGLDGAPRNVVTWLQRGFRAGRRAPVVYIHDAASVVYPFLVEPLATCVAHLGSDPLVYRDLGLPPRGATSALFDDPEFQEFEPIVELEAIPPMTLVRYASRAALGLIPPDPNMLPLTREAERRRLTEGVRS